MSRRKVVHLKSSLKSFEEGILKLGLPSFWNFPSFRISKITRSEKGCPQAQVEEWGGSRNKYSQYLPLNTLVTCTMCTFTVLFK